MAESENVFTFSRSRETSNGEPGALPAERTGQAIMAMLQNAADAAKRNEDRAKAIAMQLMEKVRASERRVIELEAQAREFLDRAEAAEQWMVRIGNEIQERLIRPAQQLDRGAQRTDRGSVARLSEGPPNQIDNPASQAADPGDAR